ncbi:hypothetical protein D3C79_954320 [compost metagenome]
MLQIVYNYLIIADNLLIVFLSGALLLIAPERPGSFFANIQEIRKVFYEQRTEKNRHYLNWCRSHECDFGSFAERAGSGLGN